MPSHDHPRNPLQAPVDPRLLLARRRETAQKLRKQRKEDTLQKRRRIPGNHTSMEHSDNSETTTQNQVLTIVSQFLSVTAAAPDVSACQALLSTLTSPSARTYLQQGFIENNQTSHVHPAKQILRKLCTTILSSNECTSASASASTCLQILLELSSLAAKTPTIDPENYYGKTPTTWAQLMTEEELIMQALLDEPMCRSHPEAYYILGNLVLESTLMRQKLLPLWPRLVSFLPASLYLLTTILQRDFTTPGKYFLQTLTPEHIVTLFRNLTVDGNAEAAVDIAWLVEGLVRREPEVVALLGEHADFIPTIINRVVSSSSLPFLVPALTAIGYISAACDGRFLTKILEDASFMSWCMGCIRSRRVLETVTLSHTFLYDFGTLGHAATSAAQQLLPSLVDVLVAGDTNLTWKREAVIAVSIAFDEPPEGGTPSAIDWELLLTTLRSMIARNDVVQALFNLVKAPDTDASFASLCILDRVFRNVPESLPWLREPEHVDVLQSMIEKYGDRQRRVGDTQGITELALDLLDDYVDGIEYSEGETITDKSDSVFTGFSRFSGSKSSSGMGRGRERTTPAWMKS